MNKIKIKKIILFGIIIAAIAILILPPKGIETDASLFPTPDDNTPDPDNNTPNPSDEGRQFLPLVQCETSKFDEPCSLCHAFQLVHRIIQFGFYGLLLPIVAIAFIIGGILLLTAAGNETNIAKGKSIVWNTFLGFLVAFAAWLVISTVIVNITPGISGINYPFVERIKWYQFPDCTPGTEPPLPNISITTQPSDPGPGPGGGARCDTLSTGPCAVANLQNSCFSNNAENASRICNSESRGDPNAESGSDKCTDGNSFSVGLFQINIIANADKIGGACIEKNKEGKAWYEKTGDCTAQGCCVPGFRNANGACLKWDCRITNNNLYEECKTQAKNVENGSASNIQAACQLSSNGTNFRKHWGGSFGSAALCNIP